MLKDDRRRDPDNPDINSRFMVIDKDLAAFWKEHRAVLGAGWEVKPRWSRSVATDK